MKRILEGLLFAADEPLSITQIRRFWKDLQPKEASHALRELAEEYEREERSFHLVEIENGFQLLTKREYYPWVGRMRNDIKTFRLSRAALETLAIIA
ncbi:MAG: SMC-Scp complex subunit ScpB, partial [Gemmatimonadetes bacterium]|nr:SMC-Scp complex subunit ScpB [Gemmatimonadota bacterium]